MKRHKMRVCSLYLSVLFILTLFGSFLTGCGHVELLEYGDKETYANSDADFMAAPSPSDINKALDILSSTSSNDDDITWAISIILNTMNLEVAKIGDVNMSFSIDEFVESVDETLRLSGLSIPTNTLKSIVIQTLNAAITEARKARGTQNERMDPSKTAFFALGERLANDGIIQITEDMTSQKLLDTASFVILSASIYQGISTAEDEAIREEILNNPNIPDEYREELIPQETPLAEGSLSSFMAHQIQSTPESADSIKNKVEEDVASEFNVFQQNPEGIADLTDPRVLGAIKHAISEISPDEVSLVEIGAGLVELPIDLTVILSHQGLVNLG
jgi:hypothetical protein